MGKKKDERNFVYKRFCIKKVLSAKIAPVPASSSFQSSMQGCVNFYLRTFFYNSLISKSVSSFFCDDIVNLVRLSGWDFLRSVIVKYFARKLSRRKRRCVGNTKCNYTRGIVCQFLPTHFFYNSLISKSFSSFFATIL